MNRWIGESKESNLDRTNTDDRFDINKSFLLSKKITDDCSKYMVNDKTHYSMVQNVLGGAIHDIYLSYF